MAEPGRESVRLRPGPWLMAGAWFGLVEGAVLLHADRETAGDLVDRLAALALVIGIDALALLALGATALVPARLLGRGRGGERRWRVRLAAAAWILLLGLVRVEDLDAHARLPGSLASGALAVLALALVAGFLGGRLATASAEAPARPWARLPALVLALAAVASLGWPAPGPAKGERPNAILISIDTLRADHLGSYGYARDTSPHLDALAAEGVRFDEAHATSHWTLPSHATMLTGLDPVAAGVLQGNDVLASVYVTLAERLAEAGWRTAAFVGNGPWSYVGAKRGFDQGFATFRHAPYAPRLALGILPRLLAKAHWILVRRRTNTATAQVDRAAAWVANHRSQPFFLFLHLYDVHSKAHRLPYEAPPPFRGRFDPGGAFDGCGPGGRCASDLLRDYADGRIAAPMAAEALERTVALYDEGIAYVDHELGRLFRRLDDLGLRERTVVLVTADHGEAFFEHGTPLHTSLHREVLRVPMIVTGPGVPAGRTVDAVVSVQDVPATLLDLLGVAGEGGTGLGPLLRGEAGADGGGRAVAFATRQMTLVTPEWAYVRTFDAEPDGDAAREELYDAREDPGQVNDLLPGTEAAEELREELLTRWRRSLEVRRALAPEDGASSLELPEDEREALRRLGYVE